MKLLNKVLVFVLRVMLENKLFKNKEDTRLAKRYQDELALERRAWPFR
jgi:hypothetical protein